MRAARRRATVKVTVRQEHRPALLSIQDDGKGFDVQRERGMGLLGIQERVSHLGGASRWNPRPGRGHSCASFFRCRAPRQTGGNDHMNVIRMLLADDHTVMRKGLRLLLESQPGFQVVAEAATGREAVTLAEQHTPDVIVMDIAMPLLNGIEAARQIAAKLPQTAIVFLSMHSDEGYVLRALKAGARAYLLKDSAENDLIEAVRAVTEGKAFFSPAISKMLVEDYMRQMREQKVEDSYELLTTREREIVQLLAEGKNNKEVAQYSEPQPLHGGDPPQQHFSKTNLHSVAELILYAVRKGVIS